MTLHLALLGDRSDEVLAHRAIPSALRLASDAERQSVSAEWIDSRRLVRTLPELGAFDGAWCVPGSPYENTAGILAALRHAREAGLPFLGTCGGFQHAVLEIATALWGLEFASHAELDPSAPDPVIAPLACSLVERTGHVRFAPGSRIAAAYGALESVEGYHCSYGLAATHVSRLAAGPLRASAWDAAGDIRAVELDGHPFFVATLFQPERAALKGLAPPLARSLLRAMASTASGDSQPA